MKLINTRCHVCENINFNYLFSTRDYRFNLSNNKFDLYSCKNCNLIKSFPEFNDKEISYYYPNINYYKNSIEKYLKYSGKYNKKFDNYLKIIRKLKDNKNLKILDYGCGDMSLVKYFLNKNINIFGFEVNDSISKIDGFQKYKEKIFFDFKNIHQSKLKFDIVILNHVFEHISDPNIFIKNIKNIMSEESFIILEIPNSNCLQIKIFKEYAIHLDQPRHRYLYNRDNITKFFLRNKFKKIHINDGFNKFFDYPLSIFKSFKNYIKYSNQNIFYKILISILLPIIFLVYSFKKNSHQSIGAIFSLNNYE